ncbi:DUF5818 domain-containing protein [Qipengyuania sp. DY56-A-20]|uniref:DUF5818 domain-containing protein n=1 Tax=Qipengyuania benthica TaxID=3067651 RepID=A0ABT9H8H2_9SPHN|nr:DUF5818 domain-containing protein [Qipengyuania sp. DY56-A-20]MDP4539617.1 DUF5818 domain-containing protein [Qipengyuania sp. DY56-A-20]
MSSAALLLACSEAGPSSPEVAPPTVGQGEPAAGTRPADRPRPVTLEGRVESGVECSLLRTPDGETWSFNAPDGADEIASGDYVRVTAEIADASFCQQGRGTLIVEAIERADPPARDRDPARAGGIAVTSEYVRGNWVAKGVGADCSRPDFAVTANSRGMSIIETRIDGLPETGVVDVGSTPGLQWDEPIPTLPIETRGPDGLAVMPPDSGQEVTLAGHPIRGDGVVFVKCSD